MDISAARDAWDAWPALLGRPCCSPIAQSVAFFSLTLFLLYPVTTGRVRPAAAVPCGCCGAVSSVPDAVSSGTKPFCALEQSGRASADELSNIGGGAWKLAGSDTKHKKNVSEFRLQLRCLTLTSRRLALKHERDSCKSRRRLSRNVHRQGVALQRAHHSRERLAGNRKQRALANKAWRVLWSRRACERRRGEAPPEKKPHKEARCHRPASFLEDGKPKPGATVSRVSTGKRVCGHPLSKAANKTHRIKRKRIHLAPRLEHSCA